jgi:hypothetical protein
LPLLSLSLSHPPVRGAKTSSTSSKSGRGSRGGKGTAAAAASKIKASTKSSGSSHPTFFKVRIRNSKRLIGL